MFSDDPITQYILSLQEEGLFINELKKDGKSISNEEHENLLERFIQMMEMYRDEVEANRKFSKDMSSILGIKPK